MVAQIKINHKLDVGKLEISLFAESSVHSDSDVFEFEFECDETGAWFDGTISRGDLTKLCAILGEPDELDAMLGEEPKIETSGQDKFIASWEIRGRKKTYTVPISLTRRKYASDKQDIMELRAENAVLRRKIASLEERETKQNDNISCLAEEILKYNIERQRWKICVNVINAIKQISGPIEINLACAKYDDGLTEFLNKFITISSLDCLICGDDSPILIAISNHRCMNIPEAQQLMYMWVEKLQIKSIVRKRDGKTFIDIIDETIDSIKKDLSAYGAHHSQHPHHKLYSENMLFLKKFREKCSQLGFD